jgi:hypothetical protein
MSLFAKISLLALFVANYSYAAENLVPNYNFDKGTRGWKLELPKDYTGKAPDFLSIRDEGSENNILAVTTNSFFRIRAISSTIELPSLSIVTISARVRADKNTTLRPGSYGCVVRLTVVEKLPQDLSPYFGFDGRFSIGSQDVNNWLPVIKLPTEWTTIHGMWRVPADVHHVRIELISNQANGTIFWDDVSVTLNEAKP